MAWQLAEPPVLTPETGVDEAWSELKEKLDTEVCGRSKNGRVSADDRILGFRGLLRGRRVGAYAFSFAAVAVIVLFAVILRNDVSKPVFQEIFTVNGQKSQIKLADGSTVALNCGSMLRIRKPFDTQAREVYLDGEGYFEIEEDRRPFIVITGNSRTTVLGTEFNVWAREKKTRVIVKSGRVRLESESAGDRVILLGGQRSQIGEDKKPLEPEEVDVDRLLGWLEGKLVFELTPLDEIIAELERTYDVQIDVDDAELASLTLTATFEQVSIETVLSSICLTLGTEYGYGDGRYTIVR